MAKRKLILDIGASTLKLAEFNVGANGAQLVNYAIEQLPGPADTVEDAVLLTSVLEEMCKARGIKPGPVSISLSGQAAFTKFASIPFTGGQDRFDQLVRYEIEQNIPFPIDEMVCDYQVLGESASGDKNVIIVAVKTDLSEAVCAAVNAAGFQAESVEVSSLALTNAVNASLSEEGCVVILDIGAKTSSLVIAEGDKIYDRSIPVAGNTITREIASAFGCSIEEAEAFKRERAYVSLGGVAEDEDESVDKLSKICRSVLTRLTAEISRSINFYRSQQGGGVPVKFYLTGGTALLPQIDEFFAESLQIEVELFNPFSIVQSPTNADEDQLAADALQLGPVTGLAIKAQTSKAGAVNLLPPSLVSARADVAKLPIVAIAGVLAITASVLCIMAVNHSKEVADVTLQNVLNRASTIKKVDLKVTKAKEELDVMAKKASDFNELLTRRASAVSDIAVFRRALSDGMWIEKWASSPVKSSTRRAARVTVRGWADDMKAIVDKTKGTGKSTASEIVLERLKASNEVVAQSVKIAEMSMIGDTISQFVVTLEFGKSAEGESK